MEKEFCCCFGGFPAWALCVYSGFSGCPSLLYDGLLISYVLPLMALMGVLPHGVFELLGFAEVAVAGRGFARGGAFLRSLLLGVVLIIVAGLIESFVTPRVLLFVFRHGLTV
ncbi:MAG: stage II sporulation protein M [Vulcanisaeta sp.]|nr:stage II sporulation protein M [Vulcanisaeta sp.]